MLKETIGRRYSAALFALAKEAGTVDTTVGELDTFVAALDKDPAVREFFMSPVVDRAQKVEFFERGLRGRLAELTYNFLVLLIRKRRENLIETIAKQMHELQDAEAGRSMAQIATPTPLTPEEVADLARRLSNVYKRPIIAKPRVDASLLGGVVVQMGDHYVDASVSGKLEEVRRHLLAGIDAEATTSPNGKPAT